MWLYVVIKDERDESGLFTQSFEVKGTDSDAAHALHKFFDCSDVLEVILTSQPDALDAPMQHDKILERLTKPELSQYFN